MKNFFTWLLKLFATPSVNEFPVTEETPKKAPKKLSDEEVKTVTEVSNEMHNEAIAIIAVKVNETNKQKEKDDFLSKLQDELAVDEGVVYEIYHDHLGLPTFGIGHLVKKNDAEYGQPVGTPVSKERVDECFREDIQTSLKDCRELFEDWDELPEEVRLITANMAFNMGRNRLGKFQRMIAAVNAANWKKAATEMKDSRWYRQVTNRAKRLVTRMENV